MPASHNQKISHESFRIHLTGQWLRSQVRIDYQPIEYTLPGDFARRAIVFWEELRASGRRHIFNGALCRLENFSTDDEILHLSLSRTCYRDLLFSNAYTDELLQKLGESGPVRALGISIVIETDDGFIPLIRRSDHVGEGPGGLDVIGGHVHPDQHAQDGVPDVFVGIADEINAELGIPFPVLDNLVCFGLGESWRHRKPELAFFLALPLTMKAVQQLAQNADEADEFTELFAVRAEKASVRRFLEEHDDRLTSSALGCLQLYARMKNWLRL